MEELSMRGFMKREQPERGSALVMALLAILVISLLAGSLLLGMQTNTKSAGHGIRAAQALNIAEAGVAEAISRIRNRDVASDGANPRMVTQIFNTAPGSVPVLGADSVAIATAQPAGQWLTYSTATKGPDALTVQYKTNSDRTAIYRYDPGISPPIQTASGMPIYVIRATGRVGADIRHVVAEVIQAPINLNMKAAVASDVDVKFTGNAVVCGFNHRADTPAGTGKDGRSGAGGCNEAAGKWEVASADEAGIWTTNTVNNGGGAQSFGAPEKLESQVGFYAGPWDVLGMTQAAFYQWIGPALASAPGSPTGILHLDSNATTQDQSGSFAFNGGTGGGFMYVDGDLTLNSSFVYKGLIYVEGDLKLNGQSWILGGVIVRGRAELKNNGGATVLYSHDAIQENIARYGGKFVTLSWREES
jgi:Tfp pilus assembly protein PilX